MKPAARHLCCAFALACSAVSLTAAAGNAAQPQRVMSLSMCTDALLLELLPPERIVSLSYYARKPANADLWPEAARAAVNAVAVNAVAVNAVAANAGTAEEVLATKPDLVLAGTYTTPATRQLLRDLHFALLEVPPANDFEEIRSVTRRVARVLDRDAAAEALIATMDATLRDLSQTRPHRTIRVAAWGEGGSIPGKGTLFDAILQAAGGINIVPAESMRAYTSFDVEQLLMARPEMIAYPGSTGDTPGRNTGVALHPLIMQLYAGKRIAYRSALYSCGTPASARAAVALRADMLAAVGAGA